MAHIDSFEEFNQNEKIDFKKLLLGGAIVGSSLFMKPYDAKAQIEILEKPKTHLIGKVTGGGFWPVSLTEVGGEDATPEEKGFIINYRNAEYSKITTMENVVFIGQQTTDDLYKIIKAAFNKELKKTGEYSVQFYLGEDFVTVSNYRLLGVTNALISVKGKGYFYLLNDQTDKLFGKK